MTKIFPGALVALFIALILPFSTIAQDSYKLEINLKGFEDSSAFLAFRYGDKNMLKDTAEVKNGHVIFEGNVKLEGGVYSLVNSKKEFLFEFLVDKVQDFSITGDIDNLVETIQYKGSKQNVAFNGYRGLAQEKGMRNQVISTELPTHKEGSPEHTKLKKELETNNAEVKAEQERIIKEMPGSLLAYILLAQKETEVPVEIRKDQLKHLNYYKAHFWDHIDFTDDRVIRTPIFHGKINQYFTNLIVQHPDTVVKEITKMFDLCGDNPEFYKYTFIYLYQKYNASKVMCIDKVFVHLVKNYYTEDRAFWATKKQLKSINERADALSPTLCGEEAPNVNLLDTNFNWHALHDVDAEYTLLLFWDPNCGHCKTDIPSLRAKMDSMKKYDMKVFAVTTQQDELDWRKFIKEHDLIWLNVTDNANKKYVFWNDFRKIYDIYSTPKLFVLDKDKIIRAKGFGSEQLFQIMDGLIEEEKLRQKQKTGE